MKTGRDNSHSYNLPLQYLARVLSLFEQKGWPIVDGPFDDKVFDHFCNMLSNLDEEQRELLMNLSEHFIWIHESDYLKLFSNSFDDFIKSQSVHGDTIFICPLLSENDFGRAKSSVSLLYSIKTCIKAFQDRYPEYNLAFFESPAYLRYDLLKPGCTLCLIDDFIGSGETAELAVGYLTNNGVSMDMIRIVTIAGMSSGIDYLQQLGLKVYAYVQCRKGITDTEDAIIKTQIMESIEKKIRVKEEYKFGYKASEGLVKMARTPNTTFPIYWLKNKYNCAPFPR